jgi:hypothetical protein
MSKTDFRLKLLLDALRRFNDNISANGGLNSEALASQTRIERRLADSVMFNLGWHAAKDNPSTVELKGSASTETLLPLLVETGEHARDMAEAATRFQEASSKLAKLNGPGRKKGSYEAWHSEPGYSVVVAMIETQPQKKVADHIRWGVKEKWLDKSIADKTHARRISLIRQRLEAADRSGAAPLGDNIVKFTPRKKRRRQ